MKYGDGDELMNEIGKRAKAKERAASGAAPESDGEDDEKGDAEAVKESAAEDVVTALGLDPKDVDLPALAGALCDLYEAHSLGGTKKKKAAG